MLSSWIALRMCCRIQCRHYLQILLFALVKGTKTWTRCFKLCCLLHISANAYRITRAHRTRHITLKVVISLLTAAPFIAYSSISEGIFLRGKITTSSQEALTRILSRSYRDTNIKMEALQDPRCNWRTRGHARQEDMFGVTGDVLGPHISILYSNFYLVAGRESSVAYMYVWV